ncbi:helix-turn-helix domain-containing protein [Acetobacter okinawensis]|uniref:helix-turn-helix domain-containing protein n=1 Tax=Acetobacter okinawensis TaxID=1076594 RepID=UPI0039EBD365
MGLIKFCAMRENRTMAGTQFTLHIHLRAWRKHRGLTLEQTANMIGSKPNTISGWETGGRKVDLDDLKKLADAYGVDPAALLFAPPGGPKFEAMKEASNLIEDMSPEHAKAWLELGKAIVSKKPEA